jgi:hypothetical protein
MIEGPTESGTSAPLTVDTAASALEALLSDEEVQDEPRQVTRPKAKVAEEAADDEVQPEQDESEVESEEVDPEEPALEGEDAEDPDAEVDDEPEVVEPRKVKIKNEDGSDGEVTDEEAGKGYMRTADYTRKTMAHAVEVKKFNDEIMPSLRAERAQLATQLGQLSEALTAMTPAEPNWNELRKSDPVEFAAEWASWQQHKDRIAQVEKAHKVALDKVADDQRGHLTQHLESERAQLLEAVPAWKNAEVAKKEKADIFAFAQKEGFDVNDLKEVYDHKVLKVLRKAWLYDKAQSALPKAKAKIDAVRVATPGAAGSKKPKATELVKAKQRLAKSGKQQDATAAFELLLADEDF